MIVPDCPLNVFDINKPEFLALIAPLYIIISTAGALRIVAVREPSYHPLIAFEDLANIYKII